MGLACKISYSADGTAHVTKENGQPSELYANLLDLLNDQTMALNAYATAFDENLGGEQASMQDLLKYFDAAQAEDNNLYPSERLEVKDFMERSNIGSLSKLHKTLIDIFKPNGTLEINTTRAISY